MAEPSATSDAATASPRFCPACGRPTGDLVCAQDATPTLMRRRSTPAPEVLSPGVVLAGRYRLGEAVGGGAYGSVFAAEHTVTRQQLAIKVLHGRDVDSEGYVEHVRRFYHEARITAALSHPNTVRVFDFGQSDGGALFLVMERIRGRTLKQILDECRKAAELLEIAEAVRIACGILDSLAEAHAAGLVHRDLKPANIMLAEIPTAQAVVKVMDFGVARRQDSTLTRPDQPMGTPAYMSPEQVCGGQVDARSDLYAVGVMLYEMLCGDRPFRGDSEMSVMYMHTAQPVPDPHERAPRPLPTALVDCVLCALAKEPAQRYPSAIAMRDACQGALLAPVFERLVDHALVPDAAVQDEAVPAPLPPRRLLHWRGLAMVALAMLAALVTVGLSLRGRPNPAPPVLVAAAGLPGADQPQKQAQTATAPQPVILPGPAVAADVVASAPDVTAAPVAHPVTTEAAGAKAVSRNFKAIKGSPAPHPKEASPEPAAIQVPHPPPAEHKPEPEAPAVKQMPAPATPERPARKHETVEIPPTTP